MVDSKQTQSSVHKTYLFGRISWETPALCLLNVTSCGFVLPYRVSLVHPHESTLLCSSRLFALVAHNHLSIVVLYRVQTQVVVGGFVCYPLTFSYYNTWCVDDDDAGRGNAAADVEMRVA